MRSDTKDRGEAGEALRTAGNVEIANRWQEGDGRRRCMGEREELP
jgi:hypothetical protein